MESANAQVVGCINNRLLLPPIPYAMAQLVTYTPLRELFAERNYQPSLSQLLNLLSDDALLNNLTPIQEHSLLVECVIIGFLSTRSGKLLQSALFNDKHQQDTFLENQYKKWLTSTDISKTAHQYLRKKWSSNKLYFLKFTKFLLVNADGNINVDKYTEPIYKLPLNFLFDDNTNLMPTFILDNKYNLLQDYIYACGPLLKCVMKDTLENGICLDLPGIYKLDIDLQFPYPWYDLLPPMHEGHLNATKQNNNSNNIPLTMQPSIKTNNNGANNNNQTVYSFDLNTDKTFELDNVVSHTAKRHRVLNQLINNNDLKTTPLLTLQFTFMAGLVDPLSQPPPNNKQVISLHLLYSMFIGLMYPNLKECFNANDGFNWKFHICFNMVKLINNSMVILKCDNFNKLNDIINSNNDNDEGTENDDDDAWKLKLNEWIPHGINTQDLELIYMINIMAVYTIYQLYSDLPIQMNPFLSCLITLWKNLSAIILLGLDIDRSEEARKTFSTPLLVRATIRGAASLRAVVATILNNHVDVNEHDFKHEPLNTFMSPHGRKLCQGALYADIRSHAAAILALGAELEDVTDLLTDLQAGDRFDEDIRYMFDYEYDDYNDFKDDVEEQEEMEIMGSFPRRCNCIFEDDNIINDDTDNINENDEDDDDEQEEYVDAIEGVTKDTPHNNLNPHDAIRTRNSHPNSKRSKSSFEFDYGGKDWRDIPRGFNLYYSPSYHFIKSPMMETISTLTSKATNEKLTTEDSTLLITAVASCIKLEQDKMISKELLKHNTVKHPHAAENEDDADFKICLLYTSRCV